MSQACEMLKDFGVPFESKVVSAHRTPDLLFEYAETAADRGIQVIIAIAGFHSDARHNVRYHHFKGFT